MWISKCIMCYKYRLLLLWKHFRYPSPHHTHTHEYINREAVRRRARDISKQSIPEDDPIRLFLPDLGQLEDGQVGTSNNNYQSRDMH